MGYRFNNRTIYSVLILFCIAGFWLFENFYTPATYSGKTGLEDINQFPKELLPTTTSGSVIDHANYSLSYNEPYEQAEWVAYVLEKSHLTYDDRKRPYFIEDPFVSSKSADWKNYRGSGYDRGHLVAAGDRRFSEQAYNETFYTSNISPQNREFNAGVWNDLEQHVRRWAKSYQKLYVFTGGVLKPGLHEIGEEDVDVPEEFYKIIVRKKDTKWIAIAFLIPNKPQVANWSTFMVSIDEVEQKTGIDFFYRLPKSEQDSFEGFSQKANWKF